MTDQPPFELAIRMVSRRASRAARMARLLSAALVVFVIGFSLIGYALYQDGPRILNYILSPSGDDDTSKISATTRNPVDSKEMSAATDVAAKNSISENIMTPEEFDRTKAMREGLLNLEAKRIDNDIKRAEAIRLRSAARSAAEQSVTSVVRTLALAAGIFGSFIFIIQTILVFIRYHTQLAQFYDNQALALAASNGDLAEAIKTAEAFSPMKVILGRQPATIHEKALDAIAALASTHLPKKD